MPQAVRCFLYTALLIVLTSSLTYRVACEALCLAALSSKATSPADCHHETNEEDLPSNEPGSSTPHSEHSCPDSFHTNDAAIFQVGFGDQGHVEFRSVGVMPMAMVTYSMRPGLIALSSFDSSGGQASPWPALATYPNLRI